MLAEFHVVVTDYLIIFVTLAAEGDNVPFFSHINGGFNGLIPVNHRFYAAFILKAFKHHVNYGLRVFKTGVV